MSKKSIEESVQSMVANIIKDTDIEMIDIEYVKEGPFKYLKVYVDKPEGITLDDTTDVSRALNKKLDELDFIKEQYFLEVSSPGIERPFKTEADYQKNMGNKIEAKFFKPVDGKKSVNGILFKKDEDSVDIETKEGIITINLKDISKINKMLEDF